MARSSPVVKYYLYQATDSVGFIWPIFTVFLLWNGLNYTEIGTLSAISAVLVVAFEIPTGYFGDRIGRRNTLAAGMAMMALSTAGFLLASDFSEFVVLYVVWALATALHHGTDDAWLYATLREATDTESFTQVRGRGGAVYQLGSGITMILGGFLYVFHPTYPFVVSALLNACGVLVVLSMPENEQTETASTSAPAQYDPLTVLREQFTRPTVRTFVLYIALFFGLVAAVDTYIQPIIIAVLEQPPGTISGVVPSTGVPEEATLGFVYAGFALVSGFASYHAETVRDRFGLRTILLICPVGLALCFLSPLLIPLLAIPVFFLMKAVHALSKPLVNQYLNDRITETGRATVLSAASMSYAVVRAPLKPLAGLIADMTTLFVTVGILGGGFLAVAAVLFTLTSPVNARTATGEHRSVTER